MKVNVMKDGNVVKRFEIWRDGEKKEEQEKSFSFQLLDAVRQRNVDMRDVLELIELGADPNYKMMVHLDEDHYKNMLKQYYDGEISSKPQMRMWTVSTAGYAINKQSSYPEIIEALLKTNKLDPNADVRDQPLINGPTIFYASAITKTEDVKAHERILEKMVSNGADVNVLDSNGNNVIHRCIDNESLKIIPKLVELGVDPFLKNKKGETPYDMVSRDNLRGMEFQRTPDPPSLKAEKIKLKPLLEPPVQPEPEKKSKFGLFGKKQG